MNYGNKDFWEQRYRDNDERFEWYKSYAALRPILAKHLTPDSKILDLGCGSSRLAEDLYDDGFKNITAIDKSPVIIQRMKKANVGHPEIQWIEMDAIKLRLEKNSFDIVIDKGTTDTIFCGENSFRNIRRLLHNISDVLKPDGLLISISHRAPDKREKHFNNQIKYGWIMAVQKINTQDEKDKQEDDIEGLPEWFYVYTMSKKEYAVEKNKNQGLNLVDNRADIQTQKIDSANVQIAEGIPDQPQVIQPEQESQQLSQNVDTQKEQPKEETQIEDPIDNQKNEQIAEEVQNADLDQKQNVEEPKQDQDPDK
ncbi:MAG: putative protein kinase domain protein [Streblomastix strix]|uniref:Methyltransferase domain-containing protein n=1 Tax=Streblomastix strix TaxID=222440 RepID=A0A5J4W7E7_9EUKA|nr:MAG: putative protein kinase domain protein [Streblomastix strix]